jgi:hypothetical protein
MMKAYKGKVEECRLVWEKMVLDVLYWGKGEGELGTCFVQVKDTALSL